MNLLPILLLTLTTTTLVLRSGDRISVDDGIVREENGVLTFRSGGTLYSLPADEIDRTASEPAAVTPASEEPRTKLAVSEEQRRRLIEELEKNHAGTPAAPSRVLESPRTPVDLNADLNREDEWSWRRQARTHEEAIRRANEELQLLETRSQELRSKIHTLLALGFKPTPSPTIPPCSPGRRNNSPTPASKSNAPTAPSPSSAKKPAAAASCPAGCGNRSRGLAVMMSSRA